MKSKTTTKEIIARSLVRLATKKSIDKITIQEIAADSGLTKTTFYNHFRDKYDLIAWSYAEPMRKIKDRIGREDYTLHDAIMDTLRYLGENRKFILNALKNSSGQNYFLHHVARVHSALLCEVVTAESGVAGTSPKMEALIKLYIYGVAQMICEWMLDGMPIPAEEFAALLEEGMPEGLKPYLHKRNAEGCGTTE